MKIKIRKIEESVIRVRRNKKKGVTLKVMFGADFSCKDCSLYPENSLCLADDLDGENLFCNKVKDANIYNGNFYFKKI